MIGDFKSYVNKRSRLRTFIFNNSKVHVVITPQGNFFFVARDVANAVRSSYVGIEQYLEGCHPIRIKKVSYEDTPLSHLWNDGDCAPKWLLNSHDTYIFIVRINELQLRPFKNFVVKVVMTTIYDANFNRFGDNGGYMNNNFDNPPKHHFSSRKNRDDSFYSHNHHRYANNFDRLTSIIDFAQHIARESYRLASSLRAYRRQSEHYF